MPIRTTDLSQLNDNNNVVPTYHHATRTVDCNVTKVCEAVGYNRGAHLNVAAARAMAHQTTGPTGNVFAEKVFKASGMVPMVDYQMLWNVPTQTVRDLLRAGWYAVLYVDYGNLNASEPLTSGDRHFNGTPTDPAIHAIGMHAFWRGKVGLSTHKHDPLNDGRRPAIQQGIVTVKFSHIRDAAYGYTRKVGFVQGWAVSPK
jgi:hypothetical protein